MPAATPRRKVRRPATQSTLFPGDLIEYSLTAEVKHRGSSWWTKSGATTTIREGESELQARKRLASSVTSALEDAIAEIVS